MRIIWERLNRESRWTSIRTRIKHGNFADSLWCCCVKSKEAADSQSAYCDPLVAVFWYWRSANSYQMVKKNLQWREHTLIAIWYMPTCHKTWTHRRSKMPTLAFHSSADDFRPSFADYLFNHIISTTRAAASSSGSSLRGWSASSALAWWWSNESKVNLNCLIQQFRVVCTINCSSGFVQGWIFDQRITLWHI